MSRFLIQDRASLSVLLLTAANISYTATSAGFSLSVVLFGSESTYLVNFYERNTLVKKTLTSSLMVKNI